MDRPRTAPAAPLRLFFALWPDPDLLGPLQQHLRDWAWAAPARPSLVAKLHLTLLFMDGVDPACLPRLLQIGARVAAGSPRLALRLDRAEVWPQGGIAHLAPGAPPPELARLHDALLQAVAAAAIPCDRRAFRPHLTLARRASLEQAPQRFAPLDWSADRLVLAQSMLGQGRYAMRGSWPLGEAGPGAIGTGDCRH